MIEQRQEAGGTDFACRGAETDSGFSRAKAPRPPPALQGIEREAAAVAR
jgi:hypothetical protein